MISKVKESTVQKWREFSELPVDVLSLVFDYARPHFYSQKGLSASEKLSKQTKIAAASDPNYKKGIANHHETHYLVPPNKPFDFKIGKVRYDYTNYRLKVSPNKTLAIVMTQGSAPKMEDSFWTGTFEIQRKQFKLYFVCDGHGDNGKCSEFLQKNMPKMLQAELLSRELDDENITNALTTVCVELSYQYDKKFNTPDDFGGTMLVGLLRFHDKWYFPNVGDSRAVFVNQTKCQQLTEDATFKNRRFLTWHENLKRSIVKDRIIVSDNLRTGLTRDIGLSYLCPRPKITYLEKQAGYLIFATDGFWDVTSNNELFKAMQQMIEKRCDVLQMAFNLVRGAHRTGLFKKEDRIKDATDNILVMVLKV